jgi:hypothetical protein
VVPEGLTARPFIEDLVSIARPATGTIIMRAPGHA